jgi:hypothetical protein
MTNGEMAGIMKLFIISNLSPLISVNEINNENDVKKCVKVFLINEKYSSNYINQAENESLVCVAG